ncbi:unnamed protein product [Tetraodon nigroviridis]|uniref:Chromosome 15 SCAF14992, whole genome shotgun sequence n=1 Tax=Tetraodon nigroviridis TaxID=99883 RepID=Q4RVE0_TETNG|nr:unnamed protein product [Tetraodon nigroviridis]
MTTKGKRESAAFLLAVILFVLSLFAQATECFRLTKTERRDERREAAADFQPGWILFGNVFVKRSSVDAQAGDGAHISPTSADDDANVQGDSPVCPLQTQVPPQMKPMDPSVLCGLDKMKFLLHGADVQHFAMDPGPAGPPVPLSHIPHTCGYNVHRQPPSLVMTAPYNDCFMIQEGAYYVLPMRWHDTQFSLWCPMHSVSQVTPPPTLSPPQLPQYFLPPWFYPPGVPPPAHKPYIPHGMHPQVPDQHPQVPQKPGWLPHTPQKPQEPHTTQKPHHPHHQEPQMPPGQEPQFPQWPQLPQQMVSFPKYPPWIPYPVTVPPAKEPLTMPSQQTASKTGSHQMFHPFYYPAPLSFYAPSLPWGGLVYPPVAEPPVKTKQPGFSYYPHIWNPLPPPQSKQPPPKVYPYYPPFGQLPIKAFQYPAA